MMEFFETHKALIGILVMPLTYGFVGWFTNWVALKMTFYPLTFWGIPPYLGWQGIVPKKSHKMASKAVDVITGRLLKIEEVFDKVEPEGIERELRPMIQQVSREILKDVVDDINPLLWGMMPETMKKEIFDYSDKQIPEGFQTIIKGIRNNVYEVFDLKGLVLRSLTGPNVSLTVEMFQKVGGPEFRFIEISGLYFGLLLGGIQMVIWHYFPLWWTLPIQGILVGYLTNWLAINMIFRPLREKKYLFFKYQGLFIKRQDHVADLYSNLVATKILTPRKMLEEIFYGKAADLVFHIIRSAVIRSIENTATMAKPVISLTIGPDKYATLRNQIVSKMVAIAPKSIEKIEDYVEKSMDIETTMADRMKKLSPEEFEVILRTAFQEDEWILILVGAVLGALVGLGQALYMLANNPEATAFLGNILPF
ncbi:MAG: DUF445 family protein [Leptospiraceae bacterium]|nr:DUF445 family protein [Leptospiraceae bacterium]MCP5497092.1 DUF445 family protein [Leptospiraceae bacterium]